MSIFIDKSDHKQVKRNQIKQNMTNSDNILPFYKVLHHSLTFESFFLVNFKIKMNNNSSR